MNNQPNIRKLISLSIILFSSFMFLSILYWVYQHGNLSITVNNVEGQSVNYRLVKQSNGEEIKIENSTAQETIRLERGGYDVFINNGELGSYAVVSVGGWLGTNNLDIGVSQQYGRQFIAGDSGDCVRQTDSALISYSCEGPISQFKTHIEGTDRVPPYAFAFPNTGIVGTIESTIESNGEAFIMASLPISNIDDDAFDDTHALFRLIGTTTQAVDNTPYKIMEELDPSKKYYAVNYKEGFVVYDVTFQEVFYYKDFGPDSKPTKLTNLGTENNNLAYNDVDVFNDSLIVLYATDAQENKSGESELIVGGSGQSKKYELPKSYFKVRKCGDTKICLAHKNGMDVYDLANDKPEFLFTAGTAKNFYVLDQQLVVLTDKMLYQFDLDTLKGRPVYNTESVDLVSLQTGSLGLLANIKKDNKSYVLALDPTQNNDNIDTKLFELTKDRNIKYVSAYKDKIYLSPNVGELVYDQATNVFSYDLQKRQIAAQAIDNIVNSVGIDKNKYKIINTLP